MSGYFGGVHQYKIQTCTQHPAYKHIGSSNDVAITRCDDKLQRLHLRKGIM